MPSQYHKGRRAEYFAKRVLEDLGAELVVRSAGSKSPYDLVAIFPNAKEVWFVQVKSRTVNNPEKKFSIHEEHVGYFAVKKILFSVFKKKRKG